MEMKGTRWESPILEENATALYEKNYGAFGKELLDIFEDGPYEMAVVSRLLAHLQDKIKGGV